MKTEVIFASFLLCLTFLPESSAQEICDDGWKYFCDTRGYCSCYYFDSTPRDWTQSHANCRALNANLASVHSAREAELIWYTLQTRTWIGLNDLEEQSRWKWTDGTPVDYAYGANRDFSDCQLIDITHSMGWAQFPEIIPQPCWHQYPSVCKKPRNPVKNGQFCTPTGDCANYVFMRGGYGDATTWNGASIKCAAMGMYLASVHSEAENFFLFSFSQNFNSLIGLSDPDLDGVFTWKDRSPVDYVNWATNEPQDVTETRNCVGIVTDPVTGEKLKWAVMECDSGYYNYLCKRDI